MAQPLNEWVDKTQKWIEEITKDLEAKGKGYIKNGHEREIYHKCFFRDPARPIRRDPKYFYSPADGIVLYAKEVRAHEQILEIKNKNYSVKEILMDEEARGKWVAVGIFMTFYDVHINRMPTDGLLSYEDLPPISSFNFPMLFVEDSIMAKELNYDINTDYLQNNERRVNSIYNPKFDLEYHVVQIADLEVDVIVHFNQREQPYLMQNSRIGMVRWGSQCDLLIPVDRRFNFEILAKPHTHVEGGIDKLVKLIKK